MKTASKAAFVLFIILSLGITFIYIAVARSSARRQAGAESVSTAPPIRKLVLADGDYSMQVGQSHQFIAEYDDGSPAEGVMWSSTDDRIASVDKTGRVKALRAGETEIWAVIGKDEKAHISLSVYNQPDLSAVDAISALATDGSDDSMARVEAMALSLSKAKNKSASVVLKVLTALLRFRDLGVEGTGASDSDWKALTAAVGAAEMPLDNRILRQAALAAYCHGEKSAGDLTISFTGDCTFARFNEEEKSNQFPAVYRRSRSVTYPFDLTREVFGADDLTMINFEGTMTDSRKHKQKRFYFRGDSSYVEILTGSSVEAVTVENNHSFDYYDTGFNDTLATLKAAGVRYTTFYSPAVLEINSFRVVMISLAMVDSDFLDEFREQMDLFVRQYRGNDTLLVMNIHWGTEGASVPSQYQREIAHMMIDSGIDLVIGHHPHVLQGIELYKGHYIVYSLGNFSFGGNTVAANPQTVIFRASFAKSSSGSPSLIRTSIVPCYITSTGTTVNNYQPTPVYGKTGKAVTDRLISLSSKIDGGVKSFGWHMIP